MFKNKNIWKRAWNENIVTSVQRGKIWNLIKAFGIKKDLIDKYPKHNNINNTEQHIEYKINYIFDRFKNKSGLGLILQPSEKIILDLFWDQVEPVPLAGRIVLSLFISCVQKKIDENDLLNIMMALFHFDCLAVLSNVVTWIEKITFASQDKPNKWLIGHELWSYACWLWDVPMLITKRPNTFAASIPSWIEERRNLWSLKNCSCSKLQNSRTISDWQVALTR